MNLSIDLGQVIIAALIGLVGWLLKSEVSSFRDQLSKHDKLITGLVGDVQRLIGFQQGLGFSESKNRRHDDA